MYNREMHNNRTTIITATKNRSINWADERKRRGKRTRQSIGQLNKRNVKWLSGKVVNCRPYRIVACFMHIILYFIRSSSFVFKTFLYIVMHQMYTMETKWLTTHTDPLRSFGAHYAYATLMLNFHTTNDKQTNKRWTKTNWNREFARKIVRLYMQHHSTYYVLKIYCK